MESPEVVRVRHRSRTCACTDPSDPPPEQVDRTVTLVHGTFARHAAWLQPGGELRDSLASIKCTVVIPFCWSGRNRHSDRLDAGRRLNEHLHELAVRYPEARHHVVAHSHGGNVALYALRDGDGRPDPRLANLRIVTLATPFIVMRRRGLPVAAHLAVQLAQAFGALTALAFLTATAVSVINGQNGESAVSMIVTALVGLVLAGLTWPYWLSPWLYRRRLGLRHRYIAMIRGETIAEEVALATSPVPGPERLTVFRGHGDEASGLLGSSQLTAWMSLRLLRLTSRGAVAFTFAYLAALVIVLGLGAVVLAIGSGVAVLDRLAAVVGVGVVVLGAASAVIAGLAGLVFVGTALLFGVDTVFMTPHALLTAEAGPPGDARIVHLPGPSSGLAHGLYDSPELIHRILVELEVATAS